MSWVLRKFFCGAIVVLGCGFFSASLQAQMYLSWPVLSEKALRDKLSSYRREGYLPVDIEAAEGAREPLFSLVMRKQEPKYKVVVRTQLPAEKYAWDRVKLLRKGYNAVDLETYTLDDRLYRAAIWVKDKRLAKPQTSYVHLSMTEFKAAYADALRLQETLVGIDAYRSGGKVRFNAVFRNNLISQDWPFERGVLLEDLSSHLALMRSKGFRLVDLSGYQYKGRRMYAVLWHKDAIPWLVENELNRDAFMEAIDVHARTGYELADIEVYSTRAGLLYSGIWVQP